MNPSEPALAISALRKSFGSGPAVDGLDLTVAAGTFYALLGPNGAGKTTTLRMLMGLITPHEGGIRVFGHPIRPGAPVLRTVAVNVDPAGVPVEHVLTWFAGERVTLTDIPVYDGPAAIMDKSLVTYEPVKVASKKAKDKTAKGPAPVQEKTRAKGRVSPVVPHLLPGTQQPAPAVLLLEQKGEATDALVKWLNEQEVHAFTLGVDESGFSQAALQEALRYIRSHSADWQVGTGAVGVLGMGAKGALAVRAVNTDADFAVVIGAGDMEILKEVSEGRRPVVFVAKKDAWQEPLAVWLGRFKGKVF